MDSPYRARAVKLASRTPPDLMAMPVLIAFVAALQTPPAEPVRAELCLARMNVMIAEAMRETGRVAGPSWFIRDWWERRAPEAGQPGSLSAEQRRELEASVVEHKVQNPGAYDAELGGCIDEAIEGGALP